MELITSDLELPSSELELNCLKDFVTDSELELLLSELNCKNGIDPGSGPGGPGFEFCWRNFAVYEYVYARGSERSLLYNLRVRLSQYLQTVYTTLTLIKKVEDPFHI